MLNDELLHKWVNGTITKEELEVFKLRPEFKSLQEIKKQTDQWDAPTFDEEAMLTQILNQEKPTAAPQEGKRILLANWMKYAAAAVLLLLAGWFFFPSQSPTNYVAEIGQKIDGTLPDGSTFVLNAKSNLNFLGKNWTDERTLNLDGEAFFKVKKGSTFTVKTSTGSVQVLGTKFNVRSRNASLDVICTEGKVAVISTNGNILQELNPMDAVRINNNTITENWKITSSEKDGWQNGLFSFKKVPLSEVLEELERQFEIKIDSKNIDTQTIVTCNFQNKNLELALKTTLAQVNVDFEIKDNSTVILK